MKHISRTRRSGRLRYVGNRFTYPGSVGLLESPYPSQYERRFFTNDGALLLIRPIKPDDAALLVDFFSCLSAQTIFYRFLTHLKRLPPEWIEHFTHIDYDRDVALVAVEKSDLREMILGVCRIMRSPGSTRGEVAVVVGDRWQGKGIASALLKHCTGIARELGMRSLWGLVSTENGKALALAEKFGFKAKSYSELGTTELEITLDEADA
jgi:acetyltransferase